MIFLGYLAIYMRGKMTGRKKVARGKSRWPQEPDRDDEDREREREIERYTESRKGREEREREKERDVGSG